MKLTPNFTAAVSATHFLRLRLIGLCIASLLCLSPAFAQAQDSVRWDSRANKWIYTLYNPDGSGVYKEISYTPRNQVEPSVSSKVRSDKEGFEYRYLIANKPQAKLPINNITVRVPAWGVLPVQPYVPQVGQTSAQIIALSRAEIAKEKAFLNKTVYAPHTWEPFVNLKRPERVVFGWLARYIEAQPNFSGIEPGQTQGSFAVLRPELPGVALMNIKGDTDDLMNAGSLPNSGPIADHAAEVRSHDFVEVPVLVPAIIAPQPYNAAELARRIKAHVNTWTVLEVIEQPLLDTLNIQLDRLIAILQINDKAGARQAINTLLTSLLSKHPGMTHPQFENDADEHDAQQLPNKMKVKSPSGKEASPAATPARPGINRIAVCALGIDLRYLQARMD